MIMNPQFFCGQKPTDRGQFGMRRFFRLRSEYNKNVNGGIRDASCIYSWDFGFDLDRSSNFWRRAGKAGDGSFLRSDRRCMSVLSLCCVEEGKGS